MSYLLKSNRRRVLISKMKEAKDYIPIMFVLYIFVINTEAHISHFNFTPVGNTYLSVWKFRSSGPNIIEVFTIPQN